MVEAELVGGEREEVGFEVINSAVADFVDGIDKFVNEGERGVVEVLSDEGNLGIVGGHGGFLVGRPQVRDFGEGDWAPEWNVFLVMVPTDRSTLTKLLTGRQADNQTWMIDIRQLDMICL